jgi:hypothetical protein
MIAIRIFTRDNKRNYEKFPAQKVSLKKRASESYQKLTPDKYLQRQTKFHSIKAGGQLPNTAS